VVISERRINNEKVGDNKEVIGFSACPAVLAIVVGA
jgi:hypothetical protein